MKALKETTDWALPSHTYVLDGTNLLGYVKQGTIDVHWFTKPIKGFDKRGRKFEEVEVAQMNWRDTLKAFVESAEPLPFIKRVQGSKPNTWYEVNTDENTCTCPGFQFRGSCKHVKELEAV
jgi:hypothetical protein